MPTNHIEGCHDTTEYENELISPDLFSRQTVHTIRSVYSQKGLNAALGRKKRETPPVPAKITGDVEARIIALSCSEPPEGQNKWTLRLLAGRAVKWMKSLISFWVKPENRSQ